MNRTITAWQRRRARLQGSSAGRLLLGALALFYGAAVVLRRLLYDLKILKAKRLRAKVICIGNLTTGGTGKTPAVLLAAQTLRKRNHAVAILSRGYGRKNQNGGVTILLDDKSPPWTECGDEPWMMHHSLHGQNIPILVCGDRAKAGQEAITFYHSRLLILDDGFQHLKLKRDLEILLVNAADPFGGGRLLPLGNLREPVGALSRAHLIVITHADRVPPPALESLRKEIAAINPKAPILEAVHKADFLLEVKTEKRHRLVHLSGRKIVSLCGIAGPDSFESQLGKLGAEVAHRWRYPDHHPYALRELSSIEKLRQGMPVVTTFKDFTRFPQGWHAALTGEVYVLAIKLEIAKGKSIWTERLSRLAAEAGAPALAS